MRGPDPERAAKSLAGRTMPSRLQQTRSDDLVEPGQPAAVTEVRSPLAAPGEDRDPGVES
jgi:hypothetical protein